MRKPIIGILGNTYKTQPGLFSSAERMYVNSDYIESVLNNGGIPMAIPAVAMKADPEGILARQVPQDVYRYHPGFRCDTGT